ncbi:MAG TPA: FliH/SctL family protein [Bryobacteraceae bacterium]|nr:FliH/SctL family protein [Bryobacteraceae bacterium]
MATLSRVLPGADSDVEAVTWRTSGSRPAAPPPARPRGPAVPSGSPPLTPVGNAELEAQVHQQLQVAFESGVREGETAARQKLEAEVCAAVERLAQAAADVAATRGQVIRRAEADVVQLSIEIARRILHRELSVDPAALAALVRGALEKLAGQQVCRVRVHPEQEPLLRATLAQLGRGADIEIVTDAAQSRGGALFETANGLLDASVETQLREIERGFADRLQERE